jgi:hypothetical protein
VPAPNRQLAGRIGGLESWSRTPDRAVRTAPARAAGPSSVDYWVAKLDPELFADATDKQKLDAADAMRRAFYTRLAFASAKARKKAAAP